MALGRASVLGLLLAFATAVAACGASRTPTASSTIEIERIAVLGDSLAVSPTEAESFPAVLQSRLEAQRLPWAIANAGVRGDTTAGALRRLDSVLAGEPRILIVALGANDGLRGVEISTISRNLTEIIERAQARGVKVLLCGMETPPLNGWSYTVAFHRIYPGLAEKYNVPLVPFLLTNVVLNPEMNGPDLIHPNAAGARQIANTVWPYLEPLVSAAGARASG
jgi:acyl-CoA thioesterase-1